jgi:hypothetical protein
VRGVDLHLGAHARERAAELVRGVRDEPPLPLGRRLQPGQHRVHGPRQPGDLLGTGRLRDPVVGRAAPDRVHPLADALDRLQGAADHPPHEPGQDRGGGGDGDGERGDERTRALRDVLQAGGDPDRDAVVLGGHQAGRAVLERDRSLVAVPHGSRGQRSGVVGHRGQHLPVLRHDLERDLVGDQDGPLDPFPRREPVGHDPGLGHHRVVEGVDEDLPLGEDQTGSGEQEDAEHRCRGQQAQPGPEGQRDEPPGVHGRGTR